MDLDQLLHDIRSYPIDRLKPSSTVDKSRPVILAEGETLKSYTDRIGDSKRLPHAVDTSLSVHPLQCKVHSAPVKCKGNPSTARPEGIKCKNAVPPNRDALLEDIRRGITLRKVPTEKMNGNRDIDPLPSLSPEEAVGMDNQVISPEKPQNSGLEPCLPSPSPTIQLSIGLSQSASPRFLNPLLSKDRLTVEPKKSLIMAREALMEEIRAGITLRRACDGAEIDQSEKNSHTNEFMNEESVFNEEKTSTLPVLHPPLLQERDTPVEKSKNHSMEEATEAQQRSQMSATSDQWCKIDIRKISMLSLHRELEKFTWRRARSEGDFTRGGDAFETRGGDVSEVAYKRSSKLKRSVSDDCKLRKNAINLNKNFTASKSCTNVDTGSAGNLLALSPPPYKPPPPPEASQGAAGSQIEIVENDIVLHQGSDQSKEMVPLVVDDDNTMPLRDIHLVASLVNYRCSDNESTKNDQCDCSNETVKGLQTDDEQMISEGKQTLELSQEGNGPKCHGRDIDLGRLMSISVEEMKNIRFGIDLDSAEGSIL